VDAAGVFGVPQHHREGQVTAFEFDDGELALSGPIGTSYSSPSTGWPPSATG
jgi:hypothetical protein